MNLRAWGTTCKCTLLALLVVLVGPLSAIAVTQDGHIGPDSSDRFWYFASQDTRTNPTTEY